MQTLDWHDPARNFIAVEKRTAAGTPDYAAKEEALLMIFNAGKSVEFTLPPVPKGQKWCHEIDTGVPFLSGALVEGESLPIGAQSVSALVLVPDDHAT